jgi:hypothetical protein
MSKSFIVFTAMVWCLLARADQSYIQNMSPKLREFLGDHPPAYRLLTNTISQCVSNRTMQIYYFYTDNESEARAAHYYPAEGVIGITIRENQEQLDEYVCLVFELLNSGNEKLFEELFNKAETGAISKSEFVREFRLAEFKVMLQVKQLLGGIKTSRREVNKSYYYKRIQGCPDEFEQYLVFTKQISPNRNRTKELEMKYDLLQKK